ncbi:FMN-dependent NADH-azoreductase [Nonomuraea sp. NPDC049684]|uniref:FMN-dependent NADH-azoreductase n=1 Tax=unclassified Nonomuraea TaxID=2593643 RepID=UPI0037AB1940
MSRLLHISASPRGTESISAAIAETFVQEYLATHPAHTVDRFDLWDGTLPEFGPAAARAKMTVFGGGTPTGEEAAAWAAAVRTFERFDSYDRYLFSVPMWNAGVPYKLKQFIDVVSQPAMIFDVHPETGYRALLTGKRAAVVYTSAVWGPRLGPEFGADHQSTFFGDWLRWTGIADVREIRHHPTLTGSYDAERKQADEQARRVARTF